MAKLGEVILKLPSLQHTDWYTLKKTCKTETSLSLHCIPKISDYVESLLDGNLSFLKVQKKPDFKQSDFLLFAAA